MSKAREEKFEKKAAQGKQRLDNIYEVLKKKERGARSTHDPDYYRFYSPK